MVVVEHMAQQSCNNIESLNVLNALAAMHPPSTLTKRVRLTV